MTGKSLLLDGALKLIADEGYAVFSLNRLAEAAGTSLAQVYQVFANRAAVPSALSERIDALLREAVTSDSESPPRDRIFDVVMTRLELLQPHKEPVLVILRELPRVPQDGILLMPSLIRSLHAVLELAGIDASGLKGRVRVQAMVAIYMRVLKTWIVDDDPGLSGSMALLDRWLRRAEQVTPDFWSKSPAR